MTFHIIIKCNSEDGFSIPEDNENKVVSIPSFYADLPQTIVSQDIVRILSSHDLTPSEAMIDFANVCLAAYTVDQIVSRTQHGHYQWSRYFKVYVPVLNLEEWQSTKEDLENCLSFLSGDKWEFTFRQRTKSYDCYTQAIQTIEQVCLLSGGLDSFIGGNDLLNKHQSVAFVSHHKGGGSGEKSLQEHLIELFKGEYTNREIASLNFFVQPLQKENVFGKEDTQRARSIMFLCLGLLVANSVGEDVPLIVPENGLISLNIPLTKTRYGSYSTRTTHPNFIQSLTKVIRKIGINNPIYNPYRFNTKGEMIVDSANGNFIKNHAYETVSCSKPGYFKRWKGKDEVHCGNCVPCIIRRASMYKAGIDNFADNYVSDVVNNETGKDAKAFRIGLARFSSPKNKIFDLLKSGPINCSTKELEDYIAVYKRGMEEVRDFLNQA